MKKSTQLKVMALMLVLPCHLAFAEDVGARVSASICRPEFLHTDNSKHKAGTAFVLRYNDNQDLLVTAFHLFGPSGGLLNQVDSLELPNFIKSVSCLPLSEKVAGTEYIAGHALKINNATALPQATLLRPAQDIAIFKMQNTYPNALMLADADAKVGDDVWLIAELKGEQYKGVYFHHAKVTKVEQNTLLNFAYDIPNIPLRASSGAPVVNSKGQVVGVNAGHYQDFNRIYGISSTLSALKKALLSGLSSK